MENDRDIFQETLKLFLIENFNKSFKTETSIKLFA